MISEVVCGGLYKANGIAVLEPALVGASEQFAASWNSTPVLPFRINAGSVYFGTSYRNDVISGPPLCLDDVEDATQIIDVWTMDSLVCNLDRNNEGNFLLMPVRGNKVRLIAADQSDCFCGAETFCGKYLRERMKVRPSSEGPFIAAAIATAGGGPALRRSVDRARDALRELEAVCDLIPDQWWNDSGLRVRDIAEVLTERSARLPDILKIREWGEFDYEQYDDIPIIQL